MSNTEANQQAGAELLVHKFLSQMSPEPEMEEVVGLLGVRDCTSDDLSFTFFIENESLSTALHNELEDQQHYTPETLDYVLDEVQKWVSDSNS